MPRIATYNIEWFNALFDDDGNLLEDDEWSARQDVKRHEQLTALGIVFTAMDADAVMVIEAPDDNRKRSTVRAPQAGGCACQVESADRGEEPRRDRKSHV